MDSWLDIMPAIPLARGVPGVQIDGVRKGVHYRFVVGCCIQPENVGTESRVDLDDPQAFLNEGALL